MELTNEQVEKYILNGGDLAVFSTDELKSRNTNSQNYELNNEALYFDANQMVEPIAIIDFYKLLVEDRKKLMSAIYKLDSRQLNNLIYNSEEVGGAINVLFNYLQINKLGKFKNFLDCDMLKNYLLKHNEQNDLLDKTLQYLPKKLARKVVASFSKDEVRRLVINGNYDSRRLKYYSYFYFKDAINTLNPGEIKHLIFKNLWKGTYNSKLEKTVDKVVETFTQKEIDYLVSHGIYTSKLTINQILLDRALTVENLAKCKVLTGHYPAVPFYRLPSRIENSVSENIKRFGESRDAYIDLVLGNKKLKEIEPEMFEDRKFADSVKRFEYHKAKTEFIKTNKDLDVNLHLFAYNQRIDAINKAIEAKQTAATKILIDNTNKYIKEHENDNTYTM